MATLPAFANLEDLSERRPGGVPENDRARAQAALVDASNLIRIEVGSDWTDPNDETKLAADVPAVFMTVACAAARRAFDNPDGVQAESLGAHSVTYAYTAIEVFLTKAEKRLVRRAVGLGVFALSTSRGADGLETGNVGCPSGTVYLDTIPPGDPMPWNEPG